MSSSTRIALVTGANKGLGFAIVRDLCRRFPGDVVLTARDEARGRAAVQQLQAEGLSPRFHQLDITDLQSIRAVRDFLLKEYGGLDVLVNNAAIAFAREWELAGIQPLWRKPDRAGRGHCLNLRCGIWNPLPRLEVTGRAGPPRLQAFPARRLCNSFGISVKDNARDFCSIDFVELWTSLVNL